MCNCLRIDMLAFNLKSKLLPTPSDDFKIALFFVVIHFFRHVYFSWFFEVRRHLHKTFRRCIQLKNSNFSFLSNFLIKKIDLRFDWKYYSKGDMLKSKRSLVEFFFYEIIFWLLYFQFQRNVLKWALATFISSKEPVRE